MRAERRQRACSPRSLTAGRSAAPSVQPSTVGWAALGASTEPDPPAPGRRSSSSFRPTSSAACLARWMRSPSFQRLGPSQPSFAIPGHSISREGCSLAPGDGRFTRIHRKTSSAAEGQGAYSSFVRCSTECSFSSAYIPPLRLQPMTVTQRRVLLRDSASLNPLSLCI